LKLIEFADKHEALASCNPVRGAVGVVYIAGILTENPVTLDVVAEAAGYVWQPSESGKRFWQGN